MSKIPNDLKCMSFSKNDISRIEKEAYNQALEDFEKALEKHQQDNWIDNLEYGITFDDVEEVIKQLKK